MEFEDSTAGQDMNEPAYARGDARAPDKPVKREHPALLICGIILFLFLLTMTWYRRETAPNSNLPMQAQEARSYTYLTEYYLQQQLLRTSAGESFALALPITAKKAADSWLEVSRKAEDPAYKGKAALNAAALYGVADNLAEARSALTEARKADPARGQVYEYDFRPLYHNQHSIFSSKANALLDSISAGPLIRSRNAELAGDSSAAISALQEGAAAGRRVLFVGAALVIFVAMVILAAIILAIVYYPQITKAFRRAATPQPEPPAWGVGSALIVVSSVYLITSLVTFSTLNLLNVNSVNERKFLMIYAPMTLACTLIILGFFLIMSGRKPWEWSVFSWCNTKRGVWFGVLTLLMTVPLIWLASFISAFLFKDHLESHPLIPLLQTTSDPWLIVVLTLLAVVMAPVIEETLFRGILFRALDAKLPFWWAALISSVLFAVGHGQLVVILPITLLGVIFAFLTKYTETLWASAAAHAAFNGFTTLVVLITAWSLRGPGG